MSVKFWCFAVVYGISTVWNTGMFQLHFRFKKAMRDEKEYKDARQILNAMAALKTTEK